jgi:2-oxoglutarate ferredoxin oxidoreductase subunit beta
MFWKPFVGELPKNSQPEILPDVDNVPGGMFMTKERTKKGTKPRIMNSETSPEGDWITGLHPMDDLLRGERLPHIWCQGCGLGTALTSFISSLKWLEKRAGWDLDKVAVVSGIGCTGRIAGYLRLDSFHTTHGRAIPFATGLKIANPELKVVVLSGDGDIAGIGGNHFIHAARRNLGITVVCVNNFNYGMTGGQVGPTTPHEARGVTAQYGNYEYPFNLPYLAAASGASFVARWTALHARQLDWTLRKALSHTGFSFVEIIAPCSTAYSRWNKEGRGLDPENLRRRGLEVMKHYQQVGRTEQGIHPKDAHVKVNEKGEVIEIIEGEFLDEDRPDFMGSMDRRIKLAEKYWQREKKVLDSRSGLKIEQKKQPRIEIQLGGFGGQGIVSAGKIIGMAASVYNNLEACFTQSYGPEARGGAAGAQIVISSNPIHHPHLTQPECMIIMSRGAYDKYISNLQTGGVLLIDDELVKLPQDHRTDITTLGIPATSIATEAGNNRAANTAMLGFWTAIEGIVDKTAMEKSVAESVPPKTIAVNLDVFEIGYQKGLDLKKE